MSKSFDFFQVQALFIQSDLMKIKSELAESGLKKSQVKFLTAKKDAAEKRMDNLDKEFRQYCFDLQNAKPTTIKNEPWISVRSPSVDRQTLNPDILGKWIIFRPVNQIDEVWAQVKELTEKGELGISAKVSTMMPSLYDSNTKVICIHTSDYQNREDLLRVREKLREIGINEVIPYKTDLATQQRIYGSDEEFLLKI